jgi:diadenosine tetraphosphate (Ap4A) HIT family hydrolase
MSDMPEATRERIFNTLCKIEKEMISYYRPEKTNIASFGNYLPRVHWHIMARFKNDSHFSGTNVGKEATGEQARSAISRTLYRKTVQKTAKSTKLEKIQKSAK